MVQETVKRYDIETDSFVDELREFADQAECDAHKLEICYMQRKRAYGIWADQLDEIYHDLDAWKTRILAVKAAHPKP